MKKRINLNVAKNILKTSPPPSPPRRCEKIPFLPPPCPSPVEGEGQGGGAKVAKSEVLRSSMKNISAAGIKGHKKFRKNFLQQWGKTREAQEFSSWQAYASLLR
jgi:hypothetical protein